MNFSKSLIAVSALAFLASCGQDATPATPTETAETVETKTETSAATTTTTTQATTAAAGVTYSDDVDYTSPGGEDTVRFTMTTDAEGVVTSLKATLEVGNDISKQLTAAFEEDAATKIVGKKLADLGDISAVGGASLTTNAFKQFVADRD